MSQKLNLTNFLGSAFQVNYGDIVFKIIFSSVFFCSYVEQTKAMQPAIYPLEAFIVTRKSLSFFYLFYWRPPVFCFIANIKPYPLPFFL